ncbi:MAG: diguanylate cyclase [Lachnospiraceae bacterium]|nr:diguanylate cyclase [Lachnospiraceae bacterium]
MANYWIVVVDDDAISLRNARELLHGEDIRISLVRSGKELLLFMEKNDPDLILLDILMPEMNGFETFRRLRDFEDQTGRKSTPVIFLSGENDSEVERRGLKIGASDFIHKPFNRDILLQRIHNTIRNTKTIENLTEEASVDSLTGFFNKASASLRLTDVCKTETGALIILDLDSFKLVNDLYGHEMGDKVLKAFAGIARKNTREEDILCRIGGDEFMAFYQDVTKEEGVNVLVRRLNEQLVEVCQGLMGESFSIPIGISAGVVFVPAQGRDYQVLFPLADKALYQIKQNGKHGYAIYNPLMNVEFSGTEALNKELKRMTRVIEERGEAGSAMWLGQDAFAWIYRFLLRFMKRHNGLAMKLLFSLSTKDPGANLEFAEAVNHFGEILLKMLRKSDIVMQSKPNQFFLLLPDLSEKDAPIVLNRINKEWEKAEYADKIVITHVMESLDFSNKT